MLYFTSPINRIYIATRVGEIWSSYLHACVIFGGYDVFLGSRCISGINPKRGSYYGIVR